MDADRATLVGDLPDDIASRLALQSGFHPTGLEDPCLLRRAIVHPQEALHARAGDVQPAAKPAADEVGDQTIQVHHVDRQVGHKRRTGAESFEGSAPRHAVT